MKRLFATLVTLATVAASAAWADLPRAKLNDVEVAPPPHAGLPGGLRFLRAGAEPISLAPGGNSPPQVVVFADYRCTTLCGPALSIVAARLRDTGLVSGRDYRLDVVGLDPSSTPAEAQAFGMQRAPGIAGRAMLVADAATIAAATRAMGYRYVYDASTRTYAHPVAAFVLTADGRLSHTLSEVALTAPELKRTILDARSGAAPNLVQSLAIACHGALEAVGRFDGGALLGMRLAAIATVLAGGVGLAFLLRRGRRAA